MTRVLRTTGQGRLQVPKYAKTASVIAYGWQPAQNNVLIMQTVHPGVTSLQDLRMCAFEPSSHSKPG